MFEEGAGEKKKVWDPPRRYPRLNYSHLAAYSHYDEKGSLDRDGRMGATQNISLGGVMIRIAEDGAFPPGTRIELEIDIDDEVISALGRIVHIKAVEHGFYDVGIQFIKVSDEDLEKLKAFFRRRGRDII